MAKQGWIKIYRKITDSLVWSDPNLLKMWILCLTKASHEDSEFVFNGSKVVLHSGEFVTGRRAIRVEYNYGSQKRHQIKDDSAWRLLKKLESMQMLRIKTTTKYSVITIINWNEYQEVAQQPDNKTTTKRQQNDTYKNDKNDKNDKNKKNTSKNSKKREYSDDDPNKKLANILFKRISENQNIKEPDLDKWANTIRLTIEQDKRSGKEVQDMIIWATSNDFWSGVILSPASLRKNFDKMNVQKNRDNKRPTSKTGITPGKLEGFNW